MPRPELDKETRFLISACLQQRAIAQALPEAGPLNGDRLLSLAVRHKVVGLLHTAQAMDGLSESVRIRLRRKAAIKAAAQKLLLQEWALLGARFEQEGLAVLMVKGPALASQLFGDPMAREYRDIDLLVRRHDFDRVSELFVAEGYHMEATPRHHTFYRPGLPVYFELHAAQRRTIGVAPLSPASAWGRSVTVEGPEFSARTLARKDHALLCLLHGNHHSWCQLQWLLDLLAFPELQAVAEQTPERLGFPSAPKVLAEFRRLEEALHGGPLPPTEAARAFAADDPKRLKQDTDLLSQSRLYGFWGRLGFVLQILGMIFQPSQEDRRVFRRWPGAGLWVWFARPLLLVRRRWRRWNRTPTVAV